MRVSTKKKKLIRKKKITIQFLKNFFFRICFLAHKCYQVNDKPILVIILGTFFFGFFSRGVTRSGRQKYVKKNQISKI